MLKEIKKKLLDSLSSIDAGEMDQPSLDSEFDYSVKEGTKQSFFKDERKPDHEVYVTKVEEYITPLQSPSVFKSTNTPENAPATGSVDI